MLRAMTCTENEYNTSMILSSLENHIDRQHDINETLDQEQLKYISTKMNPTNDCIDACTSHAQQKDLMSINITSPVSSKSSKMKIPSEYHESTKSSTLKISKGIKARKKKHVQWTTITVHEFGIGIGGSALSERGGPSIGLADVPEFTWTTKVGEMAKCNEGIRRFSRKERIRLLQMADYTDAMIERYSNETQIILESRRRTLLEDQVNIHLNDVHSRKRKRMSINSETNLGRGFRRPSIIPSNYV